MPEDLSDPASWVKEEGNSLPFAARHPPCHMSVTSYCTSEFFLKEKRTLEVTSKAVPVVSPGPPLALWVFSKRS